jgi:hypothetical protein
MRFCPVERSQGWKHFFRVRVREEYKEYKEYKEFNEFRSRP